MNPQIDNSYVRLPLLAECEVRLCWRCGWWSYFGRMIAQIWWPLRNKAIIANEGNTAMQQTREMECLTTCKEKLLSCGRSNRRTTFILLEQTVQAGGGVVFLNQSTRLLRKLKYAPDPSSQNNFSTLHHCVFRVSEATENTSGESH